MRENIIALFSDPIFLCLLAGTAIIVILYMLNWEEWNPFPRRQPVRRPPRSHSRSSAVEMQAIREYEPPSATEPETPVLKVIVEPRTAEKPTKLRDHTDPQQKALAAAPKIGNGTLVMRRRISSGRPKAGSPADVPDRPPVSVSDPLTDTGAMPNTPTVSEPDEEEDDLLERETFRIDPATSQTELDRDWAIAAAAFDDSDDEPATIIERALEPTVPKILEPTIRTPSYRAKPKKKE